MPRFARLCCLAAMLLVQLWPACVRAAEGMLTLGVMNTHLSLPIFVAEAQGFFAAEGVRVKLRSCRHGSVCLKELIEGEADVVTAADAPIVLQSFERADFQVIASIASSWHAIGLMKQARELKAPADLSGRRIGFVPNSGSEYFLDAYLMMHGIDPDTVHRVPMKPEESNRLLNAGKVDAVAVWDPWLYEGLHDGLGKALMPGCEQVYELSWNLAAHPQVMRTRQGELAAMLRALQRAQEFIRLQPERAQNILKARLGVDAGFVASAWPNVRYRLSLDRALVASLQKQARWAVRERRVTAPTAPDFSNFVDPSLLRAVVPRAVDLSAS